MSVRFPYEPRKGQKELMKWIADTIEKGGHLVVEAGTGTGKTVSALYPALRYAMESGKKVLYLTRTNSQQDQVMRELRAIKEGTALYGIALQGRANMCPLAMSDEELRYGSAEELAKVCSSRKKKVKDGDEDACPYYARTLDFDMEKLRKFVVDKGPDAGTFIHFCLEHGICPYEANRALIPGAILVSAPYIYFFEPGIRRALLSWMGVGIEDLTVIVDEAHNLPEYARELVSA
jgi:DNA excision repair protein ERCC-2